MWHLGTPHLLVLESCHLTAQGSCRVSPTPAPVWGFSELSEALAVGSRWPWAPGWGTASPEMLGHPPGPGSGCW